MRFVLIFSQLYRAPKSRHLVSVRSPATRQNKGYNLPKKNTR
jgi:hypothetical protein